jgi:CxxC motif-containing protein (DUF1111 family)
VRIAPPLPGRAALERIDADAVVALADPDDRDKDGISGRVRLLDGTAGRANTLGRYGYKAGAATLKEQVADAFATDLGLSSAYRPFPHGDCTAAESDCMAAPSGESTRNSGRELSDDVFDVITAYLDSLPTPTRPATPSHGEELFAATGCAACHAPAMPARDGGSVSAYTDLLLHDMGPALDDGVGAPDVASAEWRTSPLIAMTAGSGRRYLHDGRAPTLDAAIRAHGGEAGNAREHYVALSDADRQALVAFVGSL